MSLVKIILPALNPLSAGYPTDKSRLAASTDVSLTYQPIMCYASFPLLTSVGAALVAGQSRADFLNHSAGGASNYKVIGAFREADGQDYTVFFQDFNQCKNVSAFY